MVNIMGNIIFIKYYIYYNLHKIPTNNNIEYLILNSTLMLHQHIEDFYSIIWLCGTTKTTHLLVLALYNVDYCIHSGKENRYSLSYKMSLITYYLTFESTPSIQRRLPFNIYRLYSKKPSL